MGNKGKIGVLKSSEQSSGDIDNFDLDGEEDGNNSTRLPNIATPIDSTYAPFITALSRRGFVLRTDSHRNPVVNNRNKIFVRMEFFKT